MASAAVKVATQSFWTEVEGVPTYVAHGDVVRDGHPVIAGNEDKFGPVRIKFDHLANKEK